MEAKVERKFSVLQEIVKDHDAASWTELEPVCATYYRGLLIELHALLGTCPKIKINRLETHVRLLSSYARNPGLVKICLKIATSLLLLCGKFKLRSDLKNALNTLLCMCLNLAKVDGEVQEATLTTALSVRMRSDDVLSDAFRRMSEDILLFPVSRSYRNKVDAWLILILTQALGEPRRIYTDMTIATCFLYLSNVCETVSADVLICGYTKLMKAFCPGAPILTDGSVARRDAYLWSAALSGWSLINGCVLEGDAAARLYVAMMGGIEERAKMIKMFITHKTGEDADMRIRYVGIMFFLICKDELLMQGVTRLAPCVACGIWDWLLVLERELRAIAVERPPEHNIERICEVISFGVDILARSFLRDFSGRPQVASGYLLSSLARTVAKVGRLLVGETVVSEAADRSVRTIITSMPTSLTYRMINYNYILAPIDVLSCDNPGCVNLDGPHDAALKTIKCGGAACGARYCSVACQKVDWIRFHRRVCCSSPPWRQSA